MWKIIMLAAGLLSLLSACATQQASLDTNPAYTSHRYSSHELAINWKSAKTADGLSVEGTVTNVRPDLPYNSLELKARLLGENGDVLGKKEHVFPNRFIGSEPFRMDFPLEQNQVPSRIKFTYSYGTVEDHFLKEFESAP